MYEKKKKVLKIYLHAFFFFLILKRLKYVYHGRKITNAFYSKFLQRRP